MIQTITQNIFHQKKGNRAMEKKAQNEITQNKDLKDSKNKQLRRAILLPIHPNYLLYILKGKKTLEIRKKFPKDYVGWVYIYCTKKDELCRIQKLCHNDRFICGKDFDNRDFPHLHSGYNGKGKVVARFWCDDVHTFNFFEIRKVSSN